MNKATLAKGKEIEDRIKLFESYCPIKNSKFNTITLENGMDYTRTTNVITFKYTDQEQQRMDLALNTAATIIGETMRKIYDDMVTELDNLQDD